MSLYISSKQLDRENAERPPVPLLLLSPDLGMQHRTFSEEFEFGKLLQDMFELNNTSGAEEPYFMLPSGCMPRDVEQDCCGARAALINSEIILRCHSFLPYNRVFCAKFTVLCFISRIYFTTLLHLKKGKVFRSLQKTSIRGRTLPAYQYIGDQA